MRLTPQNAALQSSQFMDTVPPCPDGFHGRGIVTCGGGIKYGGCAWVLVNLLRSLGCELPIEVWCLNDDEYDPEFAKLLRSLGARCVNAQEVRQKHPHRRLRGWELKPYAIKHSRFQEVLFLDADNVPVRDPTYLFDSQQYAQTGTVFWPDPPHFKTPPESPLWQVFGAAYCDSPDQESGQLLIDKVRCWRALCLCDWYNQHSDFYYQHVYGDKETFRFAWQRLAQPISWPPTYASNRLLFTLEQHDFEGRVLFQHRFYRKWSLYGENTHIPGFVHEALCREFLNELRRRWQPQRHLMRNVSEQDLARMESLAGRRFIYDRPGHNRWAIRLDGSGRIEEGYGPNECFWWCEGDRLLFTGTDGKRKSELKAAGAGWLGEATSPGRMQVRLLPLAG